MPLTQTYGAVSSTGRLSSIPARKENPTWRRRYWLVGGAIFAVFLLVMFLRGHGE